MGVVEEGNQTLYNVKTRVIIQEYDEIEISELCILFRVINYA